MWPSLIYLSRIKQLRVLLMLQDVKEAILADMAAAEQQRSGKLVSPFQPSLAARGKAVFMLLLLFLVVMPLSCAAALAAAGVRLAWRMLAPGSAAEDPYARPPHKGTALVSGTHGLHRSADAVCRAGRTDPGMNVDGRLCDKQVATRTSRCTCAVTYGAQGGESSLSRRPSASSCQFITISWCKAFVVQGP